MKKNVLCTMLLVVLAGCATMSLPPQEREMVKQFDAIKLTADDVQTIREMGFNPDHLSPADKVELMTESGNAILAGWMSATSGR